MPLTDCKKVFKKAMAGRYAIGAFNVNTWEHLVAIVDTAQEERSPVIVAFAMNAIEYFGLPMAAAMTKAAADEVDVPVVLHLDHGPSLDQNVKCLREGFSSVMIDGSKLSFDDNVRVTREVVAVAHPCGITVEGELGRMYSSNDNVTEEQIRSGWTDPKQARRFLDESGADALAISCGSVHGQKCQGANLDLERIAAIRDATGAPLVLHGSSGVTNESLVGAIQNGVAKINVGMYLNQGFMTGLRDGWKADPETTNPHAWLMLSRNTLKERVREKMRLFGSSGQA